MRVLDPGAHLGSPTPVTPRGQASNDVNRIIEELAQEFQLPLQPRDGTCSPSKRPDTLAERCIDRINYLFFRNKIELKRIIKEYREERRTDTLYGEHLEALYSKIRDAAWIHRESIGTPRFVQSESEFRKPAAKISMKQSQLIPQIRRTTGPIQSSKHHFEDELLPIEKSSTVEPESLRGTKRISSQDTIQSSQYVRSPKNKRRRRSAIGDQFISCKDSPSDPSTSSVQTGPSAASSSASQTNIPSIFAAQRDRSFASTVATSFDGSDDRSDSSSEYGDLDLSQADRLINIVEQLDNPDVPPQPPKDSPVKIKVPKAATQKFIQTENLKVPTLKPKAKLLEHRLVRSLPTDGLFEPKGFGTSLKSCPEMSFSSSFYMIWECYRVAVATGQPFRLFGDENELYQHASSGPIEKTPQAVWESAKDSTKAQNIILKGILRLNTSTAAEKLFNLSLQPLKSESASRLQRKFGSSRFLYLEMPQISSLKLSDHLKGQGSALKARFQEWMCTEKELLGRKWRVFHVQDVKKKNSSTRNDTPSQRLVLFAINGPGLKPVSIEEMLNWAIPFPTNLDQGFCKAYARLDLFLSQTTPTVIFKPDEVRDVADTKADGTPESVTYNDINLTFENQNEYNTCERRVMNDGCSLISVGAAKEICQLLALKSGMRPVAFQGRINGCKGVWSISAPYDTTNTEHLARWIQVTESQRKVIPRSSDLEEATCEPDRWSFEVVKYTDRLKTSALNLDFIPILENRHISPETLRQVVESQLETNFSAFLGSLDDSDTLRRWIHAEFGTKEEANRNLELGLRELGKFAEESTEQVIQLLEAGFHPRRFKHLATCIEKMAHFWLTSLRKRLRIPLGKSTMAIGMADPTGCLKPGEIHMAFSSFCDETSGESWSHLRGEVLVARHPSLRKSDIQKVKAVFKEELSHLTDVVVFPSKGCVPLAHKLQGGDYDGDTFWLCWDPRLTTDFKNAPAPLKEPKFENFGIRKDKRKLEDVLPNATKIIERSLHDTPANLPGVDQWLAESFKFKLQEDLLGKATNFHKTLAYWENSISSHKVEALADLHDLIIDSAKNGYTFTTEAFNSFTKIKLGIKQSLKKPAYELRLNPIDTETQSKNGRLHAKMDHIIDNLLFDVVIPRIEQLTRDYREKLAIAESYDAELEASFRLQEQKSNPTIAAVLKQLIIDIRNLPYVFVPPEQKRTKDEYRLQVANLVQQYTSIQPLHASNDIIACWLEESTPGAYTTWELVKASAYYTEKHRRMLTTVFLAAGKELCHIKVAKRKHRAVTSKLYSMYRPRREKNTTHRRQTPLPVSESMETSEEESFGAPG